MPRWIPILIGIVLVTLAGLAVFTGSRYREDRTITRHVRPQQDRGMTHAPPGEPGAGASLVMHGERGDQTPAAGQPVTGRSRAVIEGGPGGVETTVRMWARRGMILEATPANAMVYVNDLPIGQVRQFDTDDEVYEFPEEGSYTVRLVSPSGREKTFIVTADDEAPGEVARIRARLDVP
jgi:hypothetical protein